MCKPRGDGNWIGIKHITDIHEFTLADVQLKITNVHDFTLVAPGGLPVRPPRGTVRATRGASEAQGKVRGEAVEDQG